MAYTHGNLNPKDAAHRSPSLHEHVGTLSRYDSTLPAATAAGQLRALRTLTCREVSLGEVT